MNQPTPAIVAQAAVRRFPRPVLLVFCLAYVLAGFVGRDAWKSADMAALGFMQALASGSSAWFQPTLAGFAPEHPTLLPYWLGAWSIRLAPAGIGFDLAARLPFAILLGLAMVGTWYGTYYLARSPLAQPVTFAFGGEANATDYARTIADGGLLAFMACLGLAHLSHETTPALAQLGFVAVLFFSVAALPYRHWQAAAGAVVGALGLTLSGAPAISLLLCTGSAMVHVLDTARDTTEVQGVERRKTQSVLLLALGLLCAALAHTLDLWMWKIALPGTNIGEWKGLAELLIWFAWPAWPLALWTLWRWRDRLVKGALNRHLMLPLWFALLTVTSSLITGASDRTLLLALPALASLAAFALPTLKRQMAAVVDWFTLFFFSGCGIIIWVVWLAIQTGVPAQPAANVARLAPHFESSFSSVLFSIALAATLVWAWLVKWRVGKHRAALWKSLVLPAGGAGLCWLLLMTLWMPLLNHAQSYTTLVRNARAIMQASAQGTACVSIRYLPQGTIAALVSYGRLQAAPLESNTQCNWLATEADETGTLPSWIDTQVWHSPQRVQNAVGTNEDFWLLQRRIPVQ